MNRCYICGRLIWFWQESGEKHGANGHAECLLANPNHKSWHVPLIRPVPPRPKKISGGGGNHVPLLKPIRHVQIRFYNDPST